MKICEAAFLKVTVQFPLLLVTKLNLTNILQNIDNLEKNIIQVLKEAGTAYLDLH